MLWLFYVQDVQDVRSIEIAEHNFVYVWMYGISKLQEHNFVYVRYIQNI